MIHNHHNHCAHELKFCEKCDRPYCTKCQREWYGQTYTWDWYRYAQNPQGYQGGITAYQSSGNIGLKASENQQSLRASQGLEQSDSPVRSTTCAHS